MYIYSLFLIVFITSIKFIPKYLPGVLGFASDIYVEELLKYTNQKRAEAGLSSLKINSTLSKAAFEKAQDMFKNNYWAHVSPDGTQPWDFFVSVGYDYSYAGENLAKNFDSSKQVVDAWYDSPSHRENLLGPNYEDIGFAVVNGILDGYETTLVVQTFGKPRVPTYLSSTEPSSLPEKPVEVSSVFEVPPAVEIPVTTEVPATSVPVVPVASVEPSSVVPASSAFIDVADSTRFIGLSFVSFIGILLTLDIWYSRKKGIRKLSGHALAHLIFLLFAFGSIWLVLSPGKIL
ncbi:MAG TPA: CAP domain-containing protein [candidate division WWE3 bacterium]|uniref:CAP domain-containing protein n=1 Tax=candidate division WWE3 bacterium TaxID=2053526 RepID=A0A7C1DIE1_UNCKA|nr:CAP domain-containing protein [candidate division WWE3 bacterium]